MKIDTVTVDRDRYIGGSDIPIIFEISKFRTRYNLLLQKAQIPNHGNEFVGNVYTEYGHAIEPLIREHINKTMRRNFQPDVIIKDIYRGNTDGIDSETLEILEIKSTSHGTDDLPTYILQTQLYMELFGCMSGMIAIYDRPDDFSLDFDQNRLTIINVSYDADIVAEIHNKVDLFIDDLNKVKDAYVFENKILNQEELLENNELVTISNKILRFEDELKQMKEIEKQIKELKDELKVKMEEHGVKKWETPNGTKITLVEDGAPSEIEKFDSEQFASMYPEITEKHTKLVPVTDFDEIRNNYPTEAETCLTREIKAGRKGYVKITLPKS